MMVRCGIQVIHIPLLLEIVTIALTRTSMIIMLADYLFLILHAALVY